MREKRKGPALSKRLKMLADMVTQGNRAADVGCDHAFLSIYLVQSGKCPGCLAMDVRKGPLAAAKEHIASYGLGDYIETRLSDGLEAYHKGEARTLICAGMGGRLMERILTAGGEKTKAFSELILQPQSEIPVFRRFLRRSGFAVTEENAVLEDGKYYFAMKAAYTGVEQPQEEQLYDLYGKQLLLGGHPVLKQYLYSRLEAVGGLRVKLGQTDTEKSVLRLGELEREQEQLEAALTLLGKERKKEMVTVTIHGQKREYTQGISYETIAEEYQKEYEGMIAVVSANGKIRELFKKATKDCELDFFTLKDDVGYKTYVRTATMLFLKGVHDVFGAQAAQSSKVEFAIGHGSYVSTEGKIPATGENAEKIKARMKELVAEKALFKKKSYSLDDAMELFQAQGMTDKEKLFRYRMGSTVNIYEIQGYYDYYYGYMLPNAGYVKWFDVIAYDEGFMLLLPTKKNPTVVAPFKEQKKLFRTMKESTEWGRKIGIETVGDLNDQICSGSLSDILLIQEAEQERKIGEIAKDIVSRGNVKFVMIAGPSSSGKTSFSHRLSIQLRTLGKIPHPIALDNYFVDRERTPRDENGNYNFECLEAIDVKQFNEDMTMLLAGKRVELPTFNFKLGKQERKGDYMQLGADDVLVIEGIHGLNEKMSYALPNESKYKIYISALTTINVDTHNRIPTTDGRLLRRMVRDARTRGTTARGTIAMWPSVRRGEEDNIFPFQEDADAMFNSAQIYELAVLKTFAEPLLFQIAKGEPEYYEAKRLLKFLNYFLGMPSEDLPNNSICREFVGGSCFNV